MRARLIEALKIAGVVLLAPQLFLIAYFFRYLFMGGNVRGLLWALVRSGATLSWVFAPYLVVLCLLIGWMIRKKVHWGITLLSCQAAGHLGVALWNLVIFQTFAQVAAILPLLICSLIFVGYALARACYLASLLPLPLPPAEEDGTEQQGEE